MMTTNDIAPDLIMPSGDAAIKEWAKDVALYYANNLSIFTSDSVREDVNQGLINLDLYNGINHVETFIGLVNPLSLETINSTRAIRHYPIAAPVIDLVVGEEIARDYEPEFHIINNIGIEGKKQRLEKHTQKEIEALEKSYTKRLEGLEKTSAPAPRVEGQEPDPQEAQIAAQKLKQQKDALIKELEVGISKLKRNLRFNYKDIIEMKYGALVAHYYTELDIKSEFIEGFRSVWLQGGEGYEIDIVHDEPTFRKLNNTKVRRTGTSRSSKWEDSDAIMLEDMYSPGNIINRYPELTEEEVYRIRESGTGLDLGKNYGDVTREFVEVGATNSVFGTEFNNNYSDSDGNVRHARVRWQGFRKVKDIYYQDPVTNEQQIKTRPMKYKVQPSEKLWRTRLIGQWWIATVILNDIVTDVKPNPLEFNKLNNPSGGHPGIVGLSFNVSQQKAVAPMTKMAPYQNLYDLIMDDVVKAMSKNIGPVLELDFSKKPKKWTTLKWLSFVHNHNVKFTDSFKEVNRGPAMGQLAGNVATGRDQVLNIDFSAYIQQLLNLAAYIKQAMTEVIGVTPQRMGSVHTRENVGSVERATSQSSHVTEWYFYRHSLVRDRAIELLAEACKHSLRNNPKKLNLLLDANVRKMVDVVEDDFVNADLGITTKDAKKAKENQAVINQAAQAFAQNKGNFGFIFEILSSTSMSAKRALIQDEEERSQRQEQEANQAAGQAEQAKLQSIAEESNKDRQLEKYKADLEAKTKLEIKEMEIAQRNSEEIASKEESAASLKAAIMAQQAAMEKQGSDVVKETREGDQKDRELDIRETEAKTKLSQNSTQKQ